MNIKEFLLSVSRFSGARNGWVLYDAAPSACGHMVPQHLQVNNFFSSFTQKKASQTEPLIPLTHPPSHQTDLLWAKIPCFSIETCPLRGDIDVFFLAGVMIWWIRISKRGDNTPIVRFLVCVFLCRVLSPCSNPHFSDEYKYLFCRGRSSSHVRCFTTRTVFVGAAGWRRSDLAELRGKKLYLDSLC